MAHNITEFAESIRVVLSLLVLMGVVQFLVIPSLLAGFRQRLFGLRRELFLFAAHGHVSFSDPAYVRLRMTINGLLRFAERATFTRVIVTILVTKKATDASFVPLDDLLADIEDEEVREQMRIFSSRIGLAFLWQTLLTSPVAWALCVLILFAFVAVWIMEGGPFSAIAKLLGRRVEPVAEALSGNTCAA